VEVVLEVEVLQNPLMEVVVELKKKIGVLESFILKK
jgi:hypothetical protein